MSSVTVTVSSPAKAPQPAGEPPLGVLALGTFAIGTDGFVIAGVLPGIARDMHVTVGAAGLLVTVFAVVYGLAAPILTAAAARVDRRIVLLAGMGTLSVANLAAAVAPGEGLLMAARVVAGLGAAAYSPIALAAAVQLSAPALRGRAVSRVLAGMTISLVLGVPLGALVGSIGGWRWTFGLVAAISAAAAVGIAALLPPIPPLRTSTLRTRLALLRQPAVAANLAATFLWITGAFVAYTFIVPVLAAATGWHGAAISVLLLLYGTAAFAGNAAGGQAADRWGAKRTVLFALGSLIVSLSALALAARVGPPAGVPIAIGSLIAWAGAGWSLTPAQSHRLVGLTPAAGPEVLSLNTSAVYLGISAGAAAGGQVLTHLGTAPIGLAAALLQLLSLAVVVVARATRTSPEGPAAAVTTALP